MPLDNMAQMIRGGTNSIGDYQRLQQEFELKKQLAQAEIAKSQQLDVDKLGERAFMKAAMGEPLTPQELAAARLMDAKSGGVSFNPVTGEMLQKPRISDKINIGGELENIFPTQNSGRTLPPFAPTGMGNPAINQGYDSIIPTISESDLGDLGSENSSDVNQWDAEFNTQMQAAAGNPKLQQSLREAYAKSKLEMNESQAKQAGYADRFSLAEKDLTNENYIKAYSDPIQRSLEAFTPLRWIFGNYLNSDEYKAYIQAMGNATTAKLRQESGAVISPTEFETDAKILYPQVGDSPERLAQKERNRKAVLNSLERGAGPSYKAPVLPTLEAGGQNVNQPIEAEFKLKKLGYSNEQINEYMKAKGLK